MKQSKKKGKGYSLSDATKEYIINNATKKTVNKIASFLEISEYTVKKIIKKAGLTPLKERKSKFNRHNNFIFMTVEENRERLKKIEERWKQEHAKKKWLNNFSK